MNMGNMSRFVLAMVRGRPFSHRSPAAMSAKRSRSTKPLHPRLIRHGCNHHETEMNGLISKECRARVKMNLGLTPQKAR